MKSADEPIPELDAAGLKRFGLIMSGVVGLCFGLLMPFLFSYGFPFWPWVLAGALLVWAVVAPRSLNLLYRVSIYFGFELRRVSTPVIMILVFFLIITPASYIMRSIGRDPMARKIDHGASTYRHPKHKLERDHLERPY